MTVPREHELPAPTGTSAVDRLIERICAAVGPSKAAEIQMNKALADAFITGCGMENHP